MNEAETTGRKYACDAPHDAMDGPWGMDDLLWWPGGGEQQAGWYCATHASIYTGAIKLIPLRAFLQGNYEPWPRQALNTIPSRNPTTMQRCRYCYHWRPQTTLEYSDVSASWACRDVAACEGRSG